MRVKKQLFCDSGFAALFVCFGACRCGGRTFVYGRKKNRAAICRTVFTLYAVCLFGRYFLKVVVQLLGLAEREGVAVHPHESHLAVERVFGYIGVERSVAANAEVLCQSVGVVHEACNRPAACPSTYTRISLLS